jgi:peptide/nickel transport system permease protein
MGMQSEIIVQSAQDPLDGAPVSAVPAQRSWLRLPTWVGIVLSDPMALAGFVLFALIVLLAVFAPVIARYAPDAMLAPLSQAPSQTHWFGTNQEGEDIFSQVLYGARFSLAVGLLAGFAITALATIVGMIAGYARGWIDDLLTLLMNTFLIIPQLPLLIVIGAYVPLKGSGTVSAIVVMATVITITGWAWGARVMRSQTLSLRSRDFVQASVVAGEPTRRIVFVEILPNMISLIVNTVIMSTMGAILTEAALDYLGIGNISQITWGTMLFKAQADSALFMGSWWSFVFPGLAIAITVMTMILMNNGIDAIANPRLRVVKRLKGQIATAQQMPQPQSEVEAVL